MKKNILLEFVVPDYLDSMRLDATLAALCVDYSRETLKNWILKNYCLLNGKEAKPKTKVFANDNIVINAFYSTFDDSLVAENIPLDIAYIDEDVIVVNKHANLVVHPAAGNWSGTLVNSLIYHYPELKTLPRAGIVHRLDKDTTGLLLVARNLSSHNFLVKQLQNKYIQREYQAIVKGNCIAGETIDLPIGRHPQNRIKMSVNEQGKPAVTHYKVIKKYSKYSHLLIKLETGRTHQIRVHLAYKKFPILGDKLYGDGHELSASRQMLHATRLMFKHPTQNKEIEVKSKLPKDFEMALEKISS